MMCQELVLWTLICFRYDVPGVSAMNFVLYNSLGGGGIASLRSDPQVCHNTDQTVVMVYGHLPPMKNLPPKGVAWVDICPLIIFTKISHKNIYCGQSSLYKNSCLWWLPGAYYCFRRLQNLLEETLRIGTCNFHPLTFVRGHMSTP